MVGQLAVQQIAHRNRWAAVFFLVNAVDLAAQRPVRLLIADGRNNVRLALISQLVPTNRSATTKTIRCRTFLSSCRTGLAFMSAQLAGARLGAAGFTFPQLLGPAGVRLIAPPSNRACSRIFSSRSCRMRAYFCSDQNKLANVLSDRGSSLCPVDELKPPGTAYKPKHLACRPEELSGRRVNCIPSFWRQITLPECLPLYPGFAVQGATS